MFEVHWVKQAERELTRIWLAARDRSAVTGAASQLDSVLKVNPRSVGESRDGGERIVFHDPLGMRFRVISAERRVLVTHVWRCR